MVDTEDKLGEDDGYIVDTTNPEIIVEGDDEVVDEPIDDEIENDEELDDGTESDYEPNYSFTVHDEEHEIPERFRGLITDEESEKEVREIFERSVGLDKAKASRDDWKSKAEESFQQNQQYQERFADLSRGIEEVKYYRENDLGLLFKKLNIDEQEIFKWADVALDARADPELRREMARRMDDIEQSYTTQRTTESVRDENYEMMQKMHNIELDTALNDPDISSFRKAYDAKVGENSFNDRIREYGSAYFATHKKYLSPKEAVRAVYERESKIFQGGSVREDEPDVRREKRESIPNIGNGGHQSPVRRKFKSLDELRAYSQKRIAEIQG